MAYKIVNNMLPTSKYGIKAPYAMNPLYITVHNTGNTASARNEAAYHNSNNAQVSYHVAIDDKEAVQLIPFNRTAWHAGDGLRDGNMRSIGIEICYSMDNGYSGAKSARYKAAEENAALYIAYVLKQYGWGMDRLKRHYDWSGKDCPHKMHATGTYQAFRNRVQAHLNALNSNSSKPASKPTSKPKPVNTGGWKKNKYGTWWKNKKGTFKNGNQPITARYNGPFTNNPVSGKLPAGATIHFDEILLQDGHSWLGYTASNGKRVYLPVRTWNKVAPPKYKVGTAWGKLTWK